MRRFMRIQISHVLGIRNLLRVMNHPHVARVGYLVILLRHYGLLLNPLPIELWFAKLLMNPLKRRMLRKERVTKLPGYSLLVLSERRQYSGGLNDVISLPLK